MSGKAELMAFECQEWHLPVGTAEAFSAGNVPRLWQHWQHSKGLLSKQNARSTVGDPDSWYVTLWLTWNHKSSDHFPSLYNFSIQLHLFFIWRNTIVHPFFFFFCKNMASQKALRGSINHWNGSIVITSTHRIRPALLKKENTGHRSYGTRDNEQCHKA